MASARPEAAMLEQASFARASCLRVSKVGSSALPCQATVSQNRPLDVIWQATGASCLIR